MDVDLKLNIIGLGINRMLWARACKLLPNILATEGIIPVFGHYNRKELDGYKKYLEKLGQGDPDIIITSLGFYDDLSALETLINENSAFSQGGPPRIFFLEKDMDRFLVNLLEKQPSVRFDINPLGELHIQDPGLFIRPGEEPVRIEIDPPTEIEPVSGDEPLVTGEGNTVVYPLSSIAEVFWQDRRYTAADFVDEFLKQHPKTMNQKQAKLLLKEGEQFTISNGFSFHDLNTISFNYMEIDHVIFLDQLKKQTPAFDLFLTKFREIAKARCCSSFEGSVCENIDTIKAKTPITVCSDYPVINDIYHHVLEADGYQSVMTTEQVIDPSDRLLLSLTDTCEEPTVGVLNRDLILEKGIFNIAGFPKVTRKQSANPPDLGSYEGIEALHAERLQIIHKLKKLEDQIKNLSGSKILADQEKYMNMLAGRKLEILTVLLEMAVIWDENDDSQKRTYEENVLVFHDDPIQASTINSQLEGDGKRLFVDVNTKFSDLRAFVTLNTDILEPFLHEGFIFCYAASKSTSVRKLQQFQNELTDKTYPEITKGIENLKAERKRIQKRLIEMAYIEAYQMLKDSYLEQSDLIFTSARNAHRYFETRRFSPGNLKSICFFSSDAGRCEAIQNALSQVLEGVNPSHYDRILQPLILADSITESKSEGLGELAGNEDTKEALVQEAILQNNLKSLTNYVRRAIKEMSLISTDLLVLVHDLDVVTMLVRKMKQARRDFGKVPLLAVFSGPLNVKKMMELVDSGVLPVYYDSLFSTRDNDLLEQLRALFS